MSQNGDPKMAIFIGIYSIEELDVGFMRGGSIYIYIHIYIWYPPMNPTSFHDALSLLPSMGSWF